MSTLRETASKAHTLILWLDCNYEGETLSFKVINIYKSVSLEIILYHSSFDGITIETIAYEIFNDI